MLLWILAGIAYFLMVAVILLFFKGSAILNEDYDEKTTYSCDFGCCNDTDRINTRKPDSNCERLALDE